jgi:hypothetical protein
MKRGSPVHELSIAMSVVEMAKEESVRNGGAKVDAVHLKAGKAFRRRQGSPAFFPMKWPAMPRPSKVLNS